MIFNIINAGDSLAHEIYHSYCTSFPEDERRGEAQFWDLFDNEYAQIVSIIKEEKNIGYLILWELSEFVFVEHFEIFSSADRISAPKSWHNLSRNMANSS